MYDEDAEAVPPVKKSTGAVVVVLEDDELVELVDVVDVDDELLDDELVVVVEVEVVVELVVTGRCHSICSFV